MCKFWECKNASCPNYARNGIRLGITEIEPSPLGQHCCVRCGSFVREGREFESRTLGNLLWIAMIALLGWLAIGPSGLIVGAATGLVILGAAGAL
jgi:hypothetical protein